jgi:hypothetical protein
MAQLVIDTGYADYAGNAGGEESGAETGGVILKNILNLPPSPPASSFPSALTLPTKLKYSSSRLQIYRMHIAPHVRREAHSKFPQSGAGARQEPARRIACT